MTSTLQNYEDPAVQQRPLKNLVSYLRQKEAAGVNTCILAGNALFFRITAPFQATGKHLARSDISFTVSIANSPLSLELSLSFLKSSCESISPSSLSCE
jgi:hypothetical protein